MAATPKKGVAGSALGAAKAKSPKAKGKAKAHSKKGRKLCCLCPAQSAGNAAFCVMHNRLFESLMRQARKRPEDLAYVKKVRHTPEFAKLMTAFEKSCDGYVSGKPRPAFNFAEFSNSQVVGSGGQAEVWCRPMTWKCFRSWGLRDDGGEFDDDEECAREWEKLKNNPHTVRDYLGKNGSLRLHVWCNQYSKAYAYAENVNSLKQSEQQSEALSATDEDVSLCPSPSATGGASGDQPVCRGMPWNAGMKLLGVFKHGTHLYPRTGVKFAGAVESFLLDIVARSRFSQIEIDVHLFPVRSLCQSLSPSRASPLFLTQRIDTCMHPLVKPSFATSCKVEERAKLVLRKEEKTQLVTQGLVSEEKSALKREHCSYIYG